LQTRRLPAASSFEDREQLVRAALDRIPFFDDTVAIAVLGRLKQIAPFFATNRARSRAPNAW
jgi:hypothetical protein